MKNSIAIEIVGLVLPHSTTNAPWVRSKRIWGFESKQETMTRIVNLCRGRFWRCWLPHRRHPGGAAKPVPVGNSIQLANWGESNCSDCFVVRLLG
jgi:hypothetical protein